MKHIKDVLAEALGDLELMESDLSAIEGMVDNPQHYVEGRCIEPIDVIEDWGLDRDHYLANVLKYISRYGRKDSGEDPKLCLKKAMFYLQRRIDR